MRNGPPSHPAKIEGKIAARRLAHAIKAWRSALVAAELHFLTVQAVGLDTGQMAAVEAGAARDVAIDDAHAMRLGVADLAAALFRADLSAMGGDVGARGRRERLGGGRGGGAAQGGHAQDQSEGGAFEGHVAVPLIRSRLRGGP